ncbi:MAG: patatin-like phospholipase family protein [Gammaproteobacteria bacterium]|nr:patatin-like phospholipase family protein [Gammaproteobacteria bacterium]
MIIPATTPHERPAAGLSRREFLLFAGGALLLAACGDGLRGRQPRVGLALGGGGAKGLAHIPMLEALDELGIRPHRIAGTSIGAVVAALYAGGLSGTQIRALVEQFLVDRSDSERKLFALPRSLRWLDFIDPAFASGGLLDSSDFIAFLGENIPARRFRDLEIPLKVVTADLWSGEPVILDSGPLLSAVQASMAVPGVFAPVELNGLKLVDGGLANPLPFDLLTDECDLVIAIDVSGDHQPEDGEELSSMGVVFHSFQIMSHNILAEKLRYRQPDIYIRPELMNIRMLEFYKAREVFEGAQPAKQKLTRALKNVRGISKPRPGCSRAPAYNPSR